MKEYSSDPASNYRAKYDRASIKLQLAARELMSYRATVDFFFSSINVQGPPYRTERMLYLDALLKRRYWQSIYIRQQQKCNLTLKYAEAFCLWEYMQEFTFDDYSFRSARDKLDKAIKSNNLYIEAQQLSIPYACPGI